MYASIGNKYFFAKYCHHQAYKNYEQPWVSVHNFGKSDYDIIYRKNAPFLYMHLWFHAQLAQKILDSFYMACMVSHAFLVAFIDKLYDM